MQNQRIDTFYVFRNASVINLATAASGHPLYTMHLVKMSVTWRQDLPRYAPSQFLMTSEGCWTFQGIGTLKTLFKQKSLYGLRDKLTIMFLPVYSKMKTISSALISRKILLSFEIKFLLGTHSFCEVYLIFTFWTLLHRDKCEMKHLLMLVGVECGKKT